MTTLDVIADDVTGACDVGAELAAGGFAVRVAVDGSCGEDEFEGVRVVNTQSRAVRTAEAYARVLRVARRRPVDVLLKKIDTALRGHLGAELDAAIDGLGASAAFVAPAIPAAGRVTRDGCQWFGGLLLSETEFASDPEGSGAEASVAAVIARESRRRTEIIGLTALRAGMLPDRARGLMRAGADVFVVDAESDDDLVTAVRGILDLARPLCVAGSIGVAAALAAALGLGRARSATALETLPGPALVVSGSLHSMARSQIDALCASELAERVILPVTGRGISARERAALVAHARALLAAGRSAALVAPVLTAASPDAATRRAVERNLGAITRDVLRGGGAAALVIIGGETSHAVLGALGASELVIHGRVAPLIAAGTIAVGEAVGLPLVVKGGSGGAPDAVHTLVAGRTPAQRAAG
jgi:uncharacterized protein YgbK (DUF1537 family)